MYVTALLVGIWLLRLEAKRRHLPPERMVDLAFYAFVGGLLGGRLYYVLFKWGYYGAHPWKIIAVWEGGMAIHGGLIGGALGRRGLSPTRRVPPAPPAAWGTP